VAHCPFRCPFFGANRRLCYRLRVRSRVLPVAVFALGVGAAGACASTEFFNEGSGAPTDRASGSVPEGTLGVCKRPGTKRPPIVSAKIWDDAKPCLATTPAAFARLGYGRDKPNDDEADKQVEKILEAVRTAQKTESRSAELATMLRGLRDAAQKDPLLRDRVTRDPASKTCDLAYLFNTMAKERSRLEQGNVCPAEAYDPKARSEVCLLDTGRSEASWLGSGWDCMTHTTASTAQEQSCHRLCAYDDYCARQVSCAAPDFDLVLCALGVCLPEPRAGI